MPANYDLDSIIDSAFVAPDVFELRPDYRALLIAIGGLSPEPSDATSEGLLVRAEAFAREATANVAVEELPHIAAWREAYRGFGAKPQRTRNSLEALTRRAADGLPRVNRLTDIYNAVSVLHQIPIGGEDLDGYSGVPRLIRAEGTEPFDTTANGGEVVEHPELGEVVWADAVGVTCRRWNWRQGRRTQLTEHTTTALFILDALDPLDDRYLEAAGEDLVHHLTAHLSGVNVRRRLLASAKRAS